MATFYSVERDGVSVRAEPIGYRNWCLGPFRPLRRWPYKAADQIPFILFIDVSEESIYDEAVVELYDNPDKHNAAKWGKTYRIKRGDSNDELVEPPMQHDKDLLTFDVFIGGSAPAQRILRSRPLSDNFVFTTFVVALITTALIILWEIIKDHYGLLQ